MKNTSELFVIIIKYYSILIAFVALSHSGDNSGKTSRYSTPPLFSRTSSTNGWDNSLVQHKNFYSHHSPLLGEDGLVNLRSDVQDRLWQIIENHRVSLIVLLEINIGRFSDAFDKSF